MILDLGVTCLSKCFSGKRHDPMIQKGSHHRGKPGKVDHAVDHSWIMVDHPHDRHIWKKEQRYRRMCYHTLGKNFIDQYRHI